MPVLSPQVRYEGVNGLALLRSEGPLSFFCQRAKNCIPLNNNGRRPTTRSSLRYRSRRNRSLCSYCRYRYRYREIHNLDLHRSRSRRRPSLPA